MVSNATLGLLGAIQTSDNREEIIRIPSWTFAATVLAALQSGRKVRLSEVSSNHRSKDSDQLASIDVIPFGANLRASNSFLIDGAASFDSAMTEARKMKPHQGLVVSLHATKSLPAGEGGFFVSHNIDWVERVRSWASFGFTGRDRESRLIGLNAKMPEVSAAYGLAALDQWPKFRLSQISLREEYIAEFSRRGINVTPPSLESLANPYFIISVAPKEKQKLRILLERQGIETRDWWGSGVHSMPAFDSLDRDKMDFTDYLARTSLGVPFWNGANAKRVASLVAQSLEAAQMDDRE